MTAIRLIDDANNNGVYNAGETILDSKTFASGTLTFTPAGGIFLASGTTKNLLVAVDISSTATVGSTLWSSIAGQTYVTVANPDTVGAFATLTGNTVTVTDLADQLNITQTLIGATPFARSSNDNVVQILSLSANQDQTTISSIKVTRIGTSTDADIKAGGVKLYLDNDNSGTLNAGDTQLGTSQSFATNAATFNSLNLNVVSTTARKVLVTVSIDVAAVVGHTIGTQITATGDVVVGSPDTVTLATTPLASNLQTINSSADILTVTHTTVSNYSADQNQTNRVLDRLSLVAGAGDGITVTGIKVDGDRHRPAFGYHGLQANR